MPVTRSAWPAARRVRPGRRRALTIPLSTSQQRASASARPCRRRSELLVEDDATSFRLALRADLRSCSRRSAPSASRAAGAPPVASMIASPPSLALTLATHTKRQVEPDGDDGGEAIIEGNRRVLAAAVADARFFWSGNWEPLEEQAEKARWHRLPREAWNRRRQGQSGAPGSRVGRGGDRRRRGRGTRRNVPRGWPRLTSSPAWCGEFPELQGVIGAIRRGAGRAQSNRPRDPRAITSRWQGDAVPTAPVTVAVASRTAWWLPSSTKSPPFEGSIGLQPRGASAFLVSSLKTAFNARPDHRGSP